MDIINDFPPPQKKPPRQILSPPGKDTRATFVIVYLIHMARRFSFLSHLIKRLLKLAMSFNCGKRSKLR